MILDTPQKLLFDRLKQNLPANKSLAECLMQWLNVSSDSAYRRIRGETPLTVDELAVLSEATGLSANELLGIDGKQQILFEPNI
jgi:BetR domain